MIDKHCDLLIILILILISLQVIQESTTGYVFFWFKIMIYN